MNPRVALMRPIDDARRSATLLRARGFEPILAPVMEIFATGAQPPDEEFDGLLATSANAFAFLSRQAREELSRLKLYAAGERTAAAAIAAGFGEADAICADARALAASAVERLPRSSRLLYLAARDRKNELESILGAAGHHVVTAEVYAAGARPAWTDAEARAFATCGAALHYSRRSAELTAALAARAGLGDHLRATLHVCISDDAAEPLRSTNAERIVIATGAREALLLDALSLAAMAS